MQMGKSIEFNDVHIRDDFWGAKLNLWKKHLIRTCLDKCYETGRIDNFKKAGGLMEGEFIGIYFNDSDVYKVMEGAAYFLQLEKDAALEAEIDQIISYIEAAQEDDGYLCTYYTLVEPENKWTDMEKHEMYCGGHLIEAAVAYYKATGKRRFVEIAEKLVDYYLTVFGEGKSNWVEGHQGIELALLRLYQVTKKQAYLDFSKWLLRQRGQGYGRGMIWQRWGADYCQDDVPVLEIEKAVGHAVRATYMYAAMADIFEIEQDERYMAVLEKVWEDMHETKMYLTGGIGSTRENEGFEDSYLLPNESCYCETCASVGNVFFNHRMNLITKESKYADIIERSLYNGILSGISLDSKTFFYVNPLASIGMHHRSAWFETSCCPTNLARFLPSIGGYIFVNDADTLIVNQYIGSSFESEKCHVDLTSDFPWKGKVALKLSKNTGYTHVKLRIPAWAREWELIIDGDAQIQTPDVQGYLCIQVGEEAQISIFFATPLRQTFCNEKVVTNRGKVAFEKGPIVYCAEQVDNKGLYYNELFVEDAYTYQKVWNDELDAECISLSQKTDYFMFEKDPLYLIPYFAWDNRAPGYMKVWLDVRRKDRLYRTR